MLNGSVDGGAVGSHSCSAAHGSRRAEGFGMSSRRLHTCTHVTCFVETTMHQSVACRVAVGRVVMTLDDTCARRMG